MDVKPTYVAVRMSPPQKVCAKALRFGGLLGAMARVGDRPQMRRGSLLLSINCQLRGTGTLRKAGAGKLILAGENTLSGNALDVSAGVVNLQHDQALGTLNYCHVIAVGAAVEVQNGITVANNLYIRGDGVKGAGSLRSISGNNTWTGWVRQHSDHPDSSIGVDSGTLTINGLIEPHNGSAGSLTKVGAGALVLTHENTYAGHTTVAAGVLNIRANGALGTTDHGTTVSSGAALQVQGDVTVSESLSISGSGISSSGALRSLSGDNVWNGDIVESTSRIGVDAGTLTVHGRISGSGTFVKGGAGTLVLTGNNTYAATTDVAKGVLSISHGGALGTSSYCHVYDQATLELNGGITVARDLYVGNVSETSTAVSLRSASGDNTWTGFVRLHVDHPHAIVEFNNGSLTVSGIIEPHKGSAGSLTKTGDGVLKLTYGNNTYTGTTRVAAGSLLVNGALNGGGTVTVDAGATLGGTGTITGLVDGQGLLSPGASVGILSVATIDPAGGMDYAFEFGQTGSPDYTNTGASVNDVLRLTSDTPATGALDSDNTIDVYLGVTDLELRDEFRGGVYVDEAVDAADRALFLGTVEGADYQYYVLGDGNGTHSFEGLGYYTLDEYDPFLRLELSTVAETASFAAGSVSGSVLQFRVVPEPVLPVLFAFILPALLLRRRSRDHHGRLSG